MSVPDWARGGVLVLGAGGMLGRTLVSAIGARLGSDQQGQLHSKTSKESDIRDQHAVHALIAELHPTTVLNAAAYTDVDGCEANREIAEATNGLGPAHIAAACRRAGSVMVHFSTDYVFDGLSQRPYRPEDQASPQSAYGRSKWMGEQAVLESSCAFLTIRTSWLYGLGKRNFVEAIAARAETGEPLDVVSDQIGRPTYAADLADAVLRLLDHAFRGTTHFANEGACSWFEFAQEIVRQVGAKATVRSITTEALDRPAHRPAYSVLDTSGYVESTGDHPAPWQDALRRYLSAHSR